MHIAKIVVPKVDKPYRLSFTDRKYKVWLTEEQWNELMDWYTRPNAEIQVVKAEVVISERHRA